MWKAFKSGLEDVFSLEGLGLLIGLTVVVALAVVFLGSTPWDWTAQKVRQVTGK